MSLPSHGDGDTRRAIARDARRAIREGREGIERRQHARVRELVAFARERSPYYRELYRGVPDDVDDTTLLPVTGKPQLMERFDDWVTDRAVTRKRVDAFVADPARAGERLLGEYLVATTSGTSGIRGLFMLDERALGMETALSSRAGALLGARDTIRMLAHGGRTAVVTAPGGHFFTVASTRRFQLDHPRLGARMRIFDIRLPLAELTNELDTFDPAILSGFLGTLDLLAHEKTAGRLGIRPAIVVPGGETLTPELHDHLATAFDATVRAAYAATECSFLGIGCAEGWYHINSDWAVLEPVDADHRPVPPGEQSHTALLSNLANRVQPVLRYDLGDSILMRPDACPCGSILPAVRVQGRAADLLTFTAEHGRTVSLSPMLFGTALDRVPGLAQYQVVQTDSSTLRVRLRSTGESGGDGADRSANGTGDVISRPDEADAMWRRVHEEIARMLAAHGVAGVTIDRADEAPQREAGGKLRRIIPYAPASSR